MLDSFNFLSIAEGTTQPIAPAVHVLESEETYGKVSVEPLQRGFGLTIGNPLRRILLSSTGGSAITWVKIEDAVHEYATIPGVKEEVMELLLNIKRVRIRALVERAGKMRLDVTGPGRICAGDIATSNDFQIVNPELHLATLDSDDARLSIEFNVEQGVGYEPAIQSDGAGQSPVGVLPVDAIFSPVRKVNYNVERTRVGQVTDYERLVLEVWTDGAIRPVEAVRGAAESLLDHFFLFRDLDRTAETGTSRPHVVVSPEIYQTPIERLGLTPRTMNCLKRAHITKAGEILDMTDDELLKIRNLGEKSLEELHERLGELGIAYLSGSTAAVAEMEDGSGEFNQPTNRLSTEDLGDLMDSGSGLASGDAVGGGDLAGFQDSMYDDDDEDDGDYEDDDEEE